MINPTTYLRPKTLTEALHKLNRPEVTALAGGGFLLRGVLLPYATVVDMQDLSEFKGITYQDDKITLGGITSLQTVATSEYLLPRLRQSITRLLTTNQRNGISLGESLVAPDAPIEWLTSLVAMNATVDHVGFEKGKLKEDAYINQPIADFLTDLVHFGQPYAGFVKCLSIPVATASAGLGTAFIARTPRDIPIVNASAFLKCTPEGIIDSAHLAMGGVSRKEAVMRLKSASLVGQPADEATFTQYASTVPNQVLPPHDYRGSEAYRRAMSEVIIRRALLDAVAQ